MTTFRLIARGFEYPIQYVDFVYSFRGMEISARGYVPNPDTNLPRAGEDVEQVASEYAKLRQELIDFAKTGGPPALPAITNALRDREQAFSDDVLPEQPKEPRELYIERAVPRMRDQQPWHGDLRKKFVKKGCADCGSAICDECDGRRPESLNAFALAVHQDNQHWWYDPATGAKLDRNMGEMLMLVVSEIAECMEGERKDLMDTHLTHRKMAEVELADAVIRIADIVGSFEECVNFDAHVLWSFKLAEGIPDNKGEALYWIISPLQAAESYEGFIFNQKLAIAFARIERYADKHGYDLWGAVAEKREYNRHRADHKPEARLAANGKKF
jgi:hypothetical protein